MTMACQLSGTTSAACDVTVSEAVGTVSTAVTSTTSYTGSEMPYATVTVTGGVEKLVSATASSSEASSSADTSATSSSVSAPLFCTYFIITDRGMYRPHMPWVLPTHKGAQ